MEPAFDQSLSADDENIKHARILIVDDEIAVSKLVGIHLRKNGYTNITIINNPIEACDAYINDQSDIIILDYNMPGMNGFEVIAALKKLSIVTLPPILVLTGESSTEFCATTFRAGANDYVVKPFELTEFLARVHNLLDMHLAKKGLHNKYIEIESQTKELKEANRKLDDLNKIKSEFVSVVSHELRTPLTSIRSSAEVMRDESELEPGEKEEFLTIIINESARLNRLINDILDLQKIDAGHMTWHKSPVAIGTVAKTTIAVFKQAFADKGLYLKSEFDDEEITVLGDADKFQQVFSNFLSNALKFTVTGGVVVEIRKPTSWLTVLVIANECSTAEHITDMLGNLQVSVQHADSSETAWEIIQTGEFAIDFVLISQHEYERSGKQLLRDLVNFRKDINFAVMGDEIDSSNIDLIRHNQSMYDDVNNDAADWMMADNLEKLIEEATGISPKTPVVSISIDDTGSGMPANELAKIFQRFYQVERSDTNIVAGTGLGLSICHEIISKYSGKVHVTSKLGIGSRFTFIFPIHAV